MVIENNFFNFQEQISQQKHRIEFKYSDNEKVAIKSVCVGCGGQIQDQYILRVSPNLEWHAACLKCQECNQFLDENCTCFVKDGKTYCKRDYVRLFGAKCDKCGSSFRKNDFVMRAKSKVFHLECFKCNACDRQLQPGDEFALKENNVLFCKDDWPYQKISELTEPIKIEPKIFSQTPANDVDNCLGGRGDNLFDSIEDSESDSDSVKIPRKRRRNSSEISSGKHSRTQRVRTVLNEKQLSTLRACYHVNNRPDALIKEQLVEMTGLSARVIRVWFQNKRCKDKKKSIEYKAQIEQEKESKISLMNGVPLVASSPVKHEPNSNSNCYEVTRYQPHWKAFTSFSDAIMSNRDFNNTPGFQHLVNQLHGNYDMDDETVINSYNELRTQSRDYLDSYQSEESFTESH